MRVSREKKTISETGQKPDSRIASAGAVWRNCDNMRTRDLPRARKRVRVIKQNKRFPPTDYTTLIRAGMSHDSNVNWGTQKMTVDNYRTSYVDLILERFVPAKITTKFGAMEERLAWGDSISEGWGRALMRWPNYTTNCEQDAQDMLLLSKGIEIFDCEEGWFSEHVCAHHVLMPDETKLDLSNFVEMAIIKKYSVVELYNKIKNVEQSAEMGWNRKEVIQAIRDIYGSDDDKRTPEDWATAIASGDITLSAAEEKDHVEVFVYYVAEFDNTITKSIVLRKPPFMLPEGKRGQEFESKLSKLGFLYVKTNFCKSIDRLLFPIINDGSAVNWSELQGLGEDIYVQCREDDDIKNRMTTASKINMMLLLQGGDINDDDKLREMVWSSHLILPPGLTFQQSALKIPIMETMQSHNWIMGEMRRSMGDYRVQEKGSGGEAITATQAKMDAASSASLKTTDIRRWAKSDENWQKELYRRFVECKKGEKGYEILELFKEEMEELGVPEEAWQWDNIRDFHSAVLVGAGSPEFKVMAAEKAIEFSNIDPINEGQAKAIEDGIAAVVGRANVRRYIAKPKKDPTTDDEAIGRENELFGNVSFNPANTPILPQHNTINHIMGHLAEIGRIAPVVVDALEKEKKLPDELMREFVSKSLNGGGHIEAHLRILERDKSKQMIAKNLRQQASQTQKVLDAIFKQYQGMFPQEEEGEDEVDPEIQMQIAKHQVEINGLKEKMQVKLAERAALAQQKIEERKEAAKTDLAIKTANAKVEAATKAAQPPKPSKPTTPKK